MDKLYNDFVELIKEYNPEELDFILRVYEYAKDLHKGQFRQSGEEYISHPLQVAYILACMHADKDTVCAGLLHDTLEDTNTTYDDIKNNFNSTIANLVLGVTKMSRSEFDTKKEQNDANTRRIITSICSDVRIIIIKLADRLHNMRTLEYKNQKKQIENSRETLDIYSPLAYYIGAYKLKNELEDLAFKYINKSEYDRISDLKNKIIAENSDMLEEISYKISKLLSDKNIPNDVKYRVKNIYGIYKKLIKNRAIDDIHDLFSIKVLVDEVDSCYRTLGLIHTLYKPINYRFKDYICSPKTNLYQSLHTTVFTPEDKLVQMQIKTHEMDDLNEYGLCSYWDKYKGEARISMLEDFKKNSQIFKPLQSYNNIINDNSEFNNCVHKDILSDRVYVYSSNGELFELPLGFTAIDFAYYFLNDRVHNLSKIFINDEEVPYDYVLKNKDIVRFKLNLMNINTGVDGMIRTNMVKYYCKK